MQMKAEKMSIDRRAAIGCIVGSAVGIGAAKAAVRQVKPPIVDTHIHLFDPTRPQGVPYAGAPNLPTAKTGAFPSVYRSIAEPLGVVGAMKIEASPWPEDNLWALNTIERDDIMLGMIGNLRIELSDFAETLARYSKHPLFRGLRYGNIWGYDIVAQSRQPVFLEGVRRLADTGLVLETANPRLDLLEAMVRIGDAVPNVRLVLDHMPAFVPMAQEQAKYDALLRELGARPQIYCKLSAVIKVIDGQTRLDLAPYKSRLDTLFDTFGENRVMFGSDWPNSDRLAPIVSAVSLARAYFSSKSYSVQEKYFWRNSKNVYKWTTRSSEQKRLLR